MKQLHSILIFFAAITVSVSAQTNTVKVELLKNSWLAINGTTNIVSFKLTHKGEKFQENTLTVSSTKQKNKLTLSPLSIPIQVKNFSSDNPMALRDFLKLIQATKYPTIKVQLHQLETNAKPEDTSTKGNVLVSISLTGVTKQYSIPYSSTKSTEGITVEGSKKFSIRDFGLEPPVEMLGMIKVSEWISIDFKINCKLTVI